MSQQNINEDAPIREVAMCSGDSGSLLIGQL